MTNSCSCGWRLVNWFKTYHCGNTKCI